MVGKDGRIYDSHYDYDKDGKLNQYERAMYDDSFKSSNYSSNEQSPFTLMYKCDPGTKLIASIVWIFGFMLMIACPPIGALIIMAAIRMTEK